ncbi:MAG: type-F conjugative transfer system protein TraW [Alphaproteobacteria bacterium]|nr:type-F conjugative transfer system protein TraW [Alphaproteobacteria bacterium]
MKLLFFLSFFLFFSIPAQNLGVFGETFEIAETDLLEHIMSRLSELRKNGILEQEKTKIEARIKENILHPQAIKGITHTEIRREFKFDPTITVTRDLADHQGKIFAKKGQRFNPLEQTSWSKTMLFIDGGKQAQIDWAITKIRNKKELSKLILVNGTPIELGERLNMDVYFDQYGFLTKKLGIRHVPAIVFQRKGEKVLTVIEEPEVKNE